MANKETAQKGENVFEAGMDDDLFRRRGLSLDRLRAFHLVVKAGSIAAAAPGHSPTQTLYSRQLRELQEALGLRLFHKDGRVLKPTREGLRLANIVAGFFAAVSEEVADVHRARVPLNIGCGDAVTRWILGPALPVMTAHFPNFEFNVEHGSTTTTLEGVRTGRLHLGIVHQRADTSGLERIKMGSLEFALYLPPSMADLATEAGRRKRQEAVPLLSLSGRGNYVREVERLAGLLGLRWEVKARLSSLVMVGEFAAPMSCAAFLPIGAEPYLQPHGFKRLSHPAFEDLSRHYSAVYDPRAARIHENLAELARALRQGFATRSKA